MATYTGQSPIVGPSTPVDLDRLIAWAVRQGAQRTDELERYFATLAAGCKLLNFDFVALAAQWDLETDTGKSEWWQSRLNPGGLGITGDDNQNAASQTWPDGRESAMGHLAHMCAYVYGDATGEHWPEAWPPPQTMDKRFRAPIDAGYRASRLAHLNNTWAIDTQNNYHGKLAARANRIVQVAATGTVTPPPVEGPSMALTIRRGIILVGQRNRPGIMLNDGDLDLITHDTGNPGRGANAEMHRKFVHNPATSVSFHFTVDDKEAIQLLPLNEIGYHAGDGCNNRATDRGCFAGVATELCINSDGDWWKAYANLKDLYAAIITGDDRIDFAGRDGDFSVERITTHQAVSDDNKYCPRTILEKDLVADLRAGVAARVKAIEDGTTPEPEPGTTPAPKPQYAERAPIAALTVPKTVAFVEDEGFVFIRVDDQVKAIRDTPRLRHAAEDADHVGPPIKKGETFRVAWIFQGGDARMYYYTPFATRVRVADTERVRDAA